MISIQTSSQAAIDSATGAQQCIQNAVTVWETALTNSGTAISACTLETVSRMETGAENLHEYIKQQSTVSFEVQNLILNVFTRV